MKTDNWYPKTEPEIQKVRDIHMELFGVEFDSKTNESKMRAAIAIREASRLIMAGSGKSQSINSTGTPYKQ